MLSIVATEFPEICDKLLAELPGAQEFVKTLSDFAVIPGGEGSGESALLEFQKNVSCDAVCMIEASYPLTRAEDFRAAQE